MTSDRKLHPVITTVWKHSYGSQRESFPVIRQSRYIIREVSEEPCSVDKESYIDLLEEGGGVEGHGAVGRESTEVAS